MIQTKSNDVLSDKILDIPSIMEHRISNIINDMNRYILVVGEELNSELFKLITSMDILDVNDILTSSYTAQGENGDETVHCQFLIREDGEVEVRTIEMCDCQACIGKELLLLTPWETEHPDMIGPFSLKSFQTSGIPVDYIIEVITHLVDNIKYQQLKKIG